MTRIKSVQINFRTTPAFKRLVERQAKGARRSVAAHIETLVLDASLATAKIKKGKDNGDT